MTNTTKQKTLLLPEDKPGRGITKAADTFLNLRSEVKKAMKEYYDLNSESARVAYVRHLISKLSAHFNTTWPVAYEALKLARDNKVYSWDDASLGKKYDTFEAYFEDTFKQSFSVWLELEKIYHFVADSAPELFDEVYEVVRGKYLQINAHGVNKETLNSVASDYSQMLHGKELNFGNSKNYILGRLNRDANNKLVYETGLAAKDILTDYEQGEYPSARQAGIAAGFVKDVKRIQVLPIPEKIAAKIKEFLTPAQIQELIRLLQGD